MMVMLKLVSFVYCTESIEHKKMLLCNRYFNINSVLCQAGIGKTSTSTERLESLTDQLIPLHYKSVL